MKPLMTVAIPYIFGDRRVVETATRKIDGMDVFFKNVERVYHGVRYTESYHWNVPSLKTGGLIITNIINDVGFEEYQNRVIQEKPWKKYDDDAVK